MAQRSPASRAGAASTARPRSRSSTRPAAARAPLPPPEAELTGTAADTVADTAVAATPGALRHSWIAEAAYYIAERRGFCGGSAEDDWCKAEAEIDRLLAGASR